MIGKRWKRMVIWMNNLKARKHLLEHGKVYSIRPRRRRMTWTPHGEPLMWKRRGKRGMARVDYLHLIEYPEELEIWVDESGFDSVEEWISNLNKEITPESPVWLYVILLLSLESRCPSWIHKSMIWEKK